MQWIKSIILIVLFSFSATVFAQLVGHWEEGSPLPERLANNAVASLVIDDTSYVFSFMGIDSSKIWSGITQNAYRLNTVTGVWQQIASVPGEVGRIAAAAVGFRGKVYIFGGYSVSQFGAEITWPNVDIYDPATDTYSAGAEAPVPTDDQVAALWQDSLIYNISGWSTNTNIDNVQAYNPVDDIWIQATPITGSAVFGHSGGIIGDTIVYIDGVRISGGQFVMNGGNFMGVINPDDPADIEWSRLPGHPGGRKYRAASGAVKDRIFFFGGTSNPYNFDGIGYNGQPSSPSSLAFGFNVTTENWEILEDGDIATMDHRGIALAGDSAYVVGGMESDQFVTDHLSIYVIDEFIPIADDTVTHQTPRFGINVASNGAYPGDGFWSENPVIAGGGLLAGLAPDRMVVADIEHLDQNSDFQPVAPVELAASSEDSTTHILRFNDSRAGGAERIGLDIRQVTTSYNGELSDGFLINELRVKNLYDGEVDSLLIGGYLNTEILGGDDDTGAIVFDTLELKTTEGDTVITAEFVYVFDATAGGPYLGVVPLSQHQFRAARIADVSSEVLGSGEAEQYEWLLNRRENDPFGDPFGPADKALIFSLGGTADDGSMAPGFTLARFDSVTIGFALVGGDSESEFIENGKAAIRSWWQKQGPVLDIDSEQRGVKPPRTFTLLQNYPNPFNPETNFRFQISDFGFVSLEVYNIRGQLVQTLVNETLTPGEYQAAWDGADHHGNPAASGVYLYRLSINPQSAVRNPQSLTRKMILLR